MLLKLSLALPVRPYHPTTNKTIKTTGKIPTPTTVIISSWFERILNFMKQYWVSLYTVFSATYTVDASIVHCALCTVHHKMQTQSLYSVNCVQCSVHSTPQVPSTVHWTLEQLPSQRSLTALAPELYCPPAGHMWETLPRRVLPSSCLYVKHSIGRAVHM